MWNNLGQCNKDSELNRMLDIAAEQQVEPAYPKTAFDKQINGSHYKDLKIQPMEYALANNLNYGQANAIKYITRYKNKGQKEDLKKAIHCIELLSDYEYGA